MIRSLFKRIAESVRHIAETPDRREVNRRVEVYLREHPGISEREAKDAAATIMTDYFIEQQRAGRKVVM